MSDEKATETKSKPNASAMNPHATKEITGKGTKFVATPSAPLDPDRGMFNLGNKSIWLGLR